MQYLTDNQIDRIASDTGALLRKEKRVRFTIMPDNLGSYWEGGINGHFFRVKKGVEVELPESLATLIAESAKISAQSEEKLRAYRGRGKKLG